MSETTTNVETKAPTKAEKPKKTAEEIKAAALIKDNNRLEQVIGMLKIGVTLKGEPKQVFFNSISGKKDFQLTQPQWKAVEESKLFKPDFLIELRKNFSLDRASGATARVASGATRAKNGQSIVRSVNERAMNETGVITNQALSDAGTRLGTAIDELLKAYNADLKILETHNLLLKFYIREVVEKPKEPATPAPTA
jgi:hypothetical protein